MRKTRASDAAELYIVCRTGGELFRRVFSRSIYGLRVDYEFRGRVGCAPVRQYLPTRINVTVDSLRDKGRLRVIRDAANMYTHIHIYIYSQADDARMRVAN